MLVIASPGQGAQKPGFLTPWLELDSVTELAGNLSEAAGVDLIKHGSLSDAETIRDTAIAQPLLVASALISHSLLFAQPGLPRPDFYVGHSVGEVSAAAQAGVLTDTEAMSFVRQRSLAMAKAAAAEDTKMAAVVGGEQNEVKDSILAAGATIANINGSSQIVAAGSKAQIQTLLDNPPARARVVELQVAGAFHSPYMQAAQAELAVVAKDFTISDPTIALISNADAKVITKGKDFFDSLVTQVSQTVNWLACMQTFKAQSVSGFLELAPAGTLSGLVKRELKEVERFELNSPDQLDSARDFIRAHAGAANQ